MGRPKMSDEEKTAKAHARIMASPQQKFFESCTDGGVYIPSPHEAHKDTDGRRVPYGHFVGIKKMKTENQEGGEDMAVVVFEVMEGIDGKLIRRPRFHTYGKQRGVIYPQMTIEWGQAAGVADAIRKVMGLGAAEKESILSSDRVVVEERKAASEDEQFIQRSGLDV